MTSGGHQVQHRRCAATSAADAAAAAAAAADAAAATAAAVAIECDASRGVHVNRERPAMGHIVSPTMEC